jgi:hypothetical protein
VDLLLAADIRLDIYNCRDGRLITYDHAASSLWVWNLDEEFLAEKRDMAWKGFPFEGGMDWIEQPSDCSVLCIIGGMTGGVYDALVSKSNEEDDFWLKEYHPPHEIFGAKIIYKAVDQEKLGWAQCVLWIW